MKPSKFLMIVNPSKDPLGQETRLITDFLLQRGAEIWILQDPGHKFDTQIPVVTKDNLPHVDMAIVLGGDGTMLGSARDLWNTGIPILGINLGHLGFLTACEKEDCLIVLDLVLQGHYRLEERCMLQGRILHRKDGSEVVFRGLNDAAITRGSFSRMLSIAVEFNGRLMDHIYADGLVVATPTGSTGYNLAAGGPILVPSANALVFTPICPRSLSVRSIVTSKRDSLQFRVLPEEDLAFPALMLTIDGQEGYPIAPLDEVSVEVVPGAARLVRTEDSTFFDTIRKKLFNED